MHVEPSCAFMKTRRLNGSELGTKMTLSGLKFKNAKFSNLSKIPHFKKLSIFLNQKSCWDMVCMIWIQLTWCWKHFVEVGNLEFELERFIKLFYRLHQCWWRKLERKYVGDGDGHFGPRHPLSHHRRAPTFKKYHQHPQIVTNFKSQTSPCHQHHWHIIYIENLIFPISL